MRKTVFKLGGQDSYRLISRINEVSKVIIDPPIEVITDTTEYTRIHRGQVIWLEDREFLVSGDVYEPRFGLEEQPKYWVKRGYDLESGRMVIIKFEFHEEHVANVGPFRITCSHSPRKEGEVLRLVRGDSRFMQGETLFDDSGNNVRVIEFISGRTLYHEITEMEINHELYYHTRLAPILKKVVGCCEAIQMLNDYDLCHGDIRNDHIIIDDETGEFRWIDFDVYQNFAGFDVFSLSKVLQFVIGMGLTTFHEIRTCGRFPSDMVSSLQPTDASIFYSYRLMNLKKIYPYISDRLNTILMRFSAGAKEYYATVFELVQDLYEAIPEVPANSSRSRDNRNIPRGELPQQRVR
jgi:hypothetical protein